jgi:hypothetical protein
VLNPTKILNVNTNATIAVQIPLISFSMSSIGLLELFSITTNHTTLRIDPISRST